FVAAWRGYDDAQREARRDLWLRWLPTFAELYRICYQSRQATDRDAPDARGTLAEWLWQQPRIPPVIADLVSHAYYARPIQSMMRRQHPPLTRVRGIRPTWSSSLSLETIASHPERVSGFSRKLRA